VTAVTVVTTVTAVTAVTTVTTVSAVTTVTTVTAVTAVIAVSVLGASRWLIRAMRLASLLWLHPETWLQRLPSRRKFEDVSGEFRAPYVVTYAAGYEHLDLSKPPPRPFNLTVVCIPTAPG
jgi:hypothetical protein